MQNTNTAAARAISIRSEFICLLVSWLSRVVPGHKEALVKEAGQDAAGRVVRPVIAIEDELVPIVAGLERQVGRVDAVSVRVGQSLARRAPVAERSREVNPAGRPVGAVAEMHPVVSVAGWHDL